jgi:cytochrome c-type biogenesis protein CcmH/NrfG
MVKLQATTQVAANDFAALKKQGLEAFERGDGLMAEQSLRAALALKPQDGACLTTLGRLYLRTNRSKEALSSLENATHKDPRYSPGWHYLGMAYVMGGQLEKAISAWQKVVSQDKAYAEQHRLSERIASARSMLRS